MMHPGTFFGSYEIGPALGAGGMGEVYQARDTKLIATSRSRSSGKRSRAITIDRRGWSARRGSRGAEEPVPKTVPHTPPTPSLRSGLVEVNVLSRVSETEGNGTPKPKKPEDNVIAQSRAQTSSATERDRPADHV